MTSSGNPGGALRTEEESSEPRVGPRRQESKLLEKRNGDNDVISVSATEVCVKCLIGGDALAGAIRDCPFVSFTGVFNRAIADAVIADASVNGTIDCIEMNSGVPVSDHMGRHSVASGESSVE